jgi:hypothetical protein
MHEHGLRIMESHETTTWMRITSRDWGRFFQ